MIKVVLNVFQSTSKEYIKSQIEIKIDARVPKFKKVSSPLQNNVENGGVPFTVLFGGKIQICCF